MSKQVDGIKMATKALRAVRKRLDQISETQDANAVELDQRTPQTSGSLMPMLADVRDLTKALRTDLVDVTAELDASLREAIDGSISEMRTRLATVLANQGSGYGEGAGSPAAIRGRLEHAIDLICQSAKAQQLAREESNHYGSQIRNKVEGWLQLLATQGDMLQSQHTQLGVMADRLKTLLDRQERVADDFARRQNATHENGQGAWAEVKQARAEIMARIVELDAENESRHQSIIAYLKALEAKIDKIDVEVDEVSGLVHEGIDLGGS